MQPPASRPHEGPRCPSLGSTSPLPLEQASPVSALGPAAMPVLCPCDDQGCMRSWGSCHGTRVQETHGGRGDEKTQGGERGTKPLTALPHSSALEDLLTLVSWKEFLNDNKTYYTFLKFCFSVLVTGKHSEFNVASGGCLAEATWAGLRFVPFDPRYLSGNSSCLDAQPAFLPLSTSSRNDFICKEEGSTCTS